MTNGTESDDTAPHTSRLWRAGTSEPERTSPQLAPAVVEVFGELVVYPPVSQPGSLGQVP